MLIKASILKYPKYLNISSSCFFKLLYFTGSLKKSFNTFTETLPNVFIACNCRNYRTDVPSSTEWGCFLFLKWISVCMCVCMRALRCARCISVFICNMLNSLSNLYLFSSDFQTLLIVEWIYLNFV